MLKRRKAKIRFKDGEELVCTAKVAQKIVEKGYAIYVEPPIRMAIKEPPEVR